MDKNKNNVSTVTPKGAYLALIFAFLALAINFWAWSILSPLGVRYADELSLSPTLLAVLLATPVIIGSIGRIFLGALTDKFGGRLMFIAVCFLVMLPIISLAFSHNYWQLMGGAFFLGISGATFVIGIPFVSAWFPPNKRGLALGIYSMGNAGTAVSGFLTPRIDHAIGRQLTFLLVGMLLFIVALIFIIFVKNAPCWKPAKGSSLKRLSQACKYRITWDLSAIYFITFGAFVAFGVYLPVLLKLSYNLSLTDAATRAAGFILVATLARPVGGWLSDRFGGSVVIRISLIFVALLACIVAFQPVLYLHTTFAYLCLAFALGCCNGAVFALVGKLSKPDIMGSITGIIGAIGGIGGFLPPLVLGITYQATHSYSLALILLAVCAIILWLYINRQFKAPIYKRIG